MTKKIILILLLVAPAVFSQESVEKIASATSARDQVEGIVPGLPSKRILGSIAIPSNIGISADTTPLNSMDQASTSAPPGTPQLGDVEIEKPSR